MSQLTRRTLRRVTAPARGGVRLGVNVGAFASLFKRRQGVCAPYKALDSLRFENGLIKP